MSGVGYIGKTTNQAREVVAMQAAAERESQWGPIDGEILSYDPEKQTVKVKPLYKPMHDGKLVDMPDLEDVPMRFARSAAGAITFPIAPGTKVRLTPMMRSTELYHTEGDGAASDSRSFSLSDMEATLTGGESLNDPLPNVDPANMHVRFDSEGTFGIRGSPDGKVKIEGAQGDIYALVQEAVALCQSGFAKLGTEPTLVHMTEYATIGTQLETIAGKLAGMQL